MRLLPPLLLALVACATATDPTDDTDTVPTDRGGVLGPGEVRAGVLASRDLLMGGLAAEAREGDIVLRNDRVRFVLQGMRDANYYVTTWGGILDADVVRPEGALGNDIIEKLSPMAGIGRILAPVTIEVLDDGATSGTAHVQVQAIEAPLDLLEGTLESPGFLSDRGLRFVQDYRLDADSWLLQVQTTITSDGPTPDSTVSDVLFGSPEVSLRYAQGVGFGEGYPPAFGWSGYVSTDRDVVAMILAAPGETLEAGGLELLSEAADLAAGGIPSAPLGPDTPIVFTRLYGIGPDLATLTDAWLALGEGATETVEGTVTAPDGPVAGAWVHILVDDLPYTLATTDAEGRFSAQVPVGANARALAVGRGTGRFVDRPSLGTHLAPYADARVRQDTLDAIAGGAVARAPYEGRGVADPASPLTLGQPGVVRVTVDGDEPFMASLQFTGPDPEVDRRLVQRRAGGRAAAGWSRGGTLELAAEPGTYQLVVHRGLRHELHTEQVTLAAGDVAEITTSLPIAYSHDGWLLGDPHSHAAPSGDGGIAMEDRLVVAAANGIQVHFGTDHDHVVDYRPLVTALGLDDLLASVVSDEVSPPLRGHFNIYPVEPDPDAPNGGAWSWWLQIPTSTEQIVDFLRERHGDDFILQSNHPLDNGMPAAAGWSPGTVARPDRWTSRISAMEVMNAGDYRDYLPLYLDLVSRGQDVTGTGVSDSHDHFGGRVGFSATFLGAGVDEPSELTDELLRQTMRKGATVVSRGPFLTLSTPPGEVVSPGTVVEATALTPSWMQVDRLVLFRNGEEVERLEGASGSFTLDTDEDAVFVVFAEGDTPMLPLDGNTPWAMSWLVRVDAGGDGWTAPLPPLSGL